MVVWTSYVAFSLMSSPRTGSGAVMRPDSFVDFGAILIVCLRFYLSSFLTFSFFTFFFPHAFFMLSFLLITSLLIYFLIYRSTA